MANYIFYITNQEKYIEHARASVESVRNNTNMKFRSVLFFVGETGNVPGFDVRVNMTQTPGVSWWKQQTLSTKEILDHFISTDRLMYMDIDTYACGDVAPLFDLLEVCDYAGAHSPRRYVNRDLGMNIPRSFAEYNIGVNLMIPNDAVYRLFCKACKLFDEVGEDNGVDDQSILRAALWQTMHEDPRFRCLTFPPEWNLRFNFPYAIWKEAVVLHGYEGESNYADIAAKINYDRGPKVERNKQP